jgi:hypothetical protein
MEYRERNHIESLTRVLLHGLMWLGAIGIAWKSLKPAGWLFWLIDFAVRNEPASYYYFAIGALGILAGKFWLDSVAPRAFYHLLTAICAFAGTMFILGLMLPL